jgi:hypothetical protein
MTRTTILMLLGCLLALGVTGCAGAYTNIEPVGENKYRVTEVKQGAFRLKGVLLECTGEGATMKCKEVAVQ